MTSLDCSLLTDGSSDKALLHILQWLLSKHIPDRVAQCTWCDLRRLRTPPRTLFERIVQAATLYPCDILFIHRDAENQPFARRYDEIHSAVQEAKKCGVAFPHVCIVPVRMTETWLLLDVAAIRKAAGNPNGTELLVPPRPQTLEDLPDPKACLHDLLKVSCGLRGRQLKKFRPESLTDLVASYSTDFGSLRVLPAFQRLEEHIKEVVPRLS